jgi:hypothetical protein
MTADENVRRQTVESRSTGTVDSEQQTADGRQQKHGRQAGVIWWGLAISVFSTSLVWLQAKNAGTF